MADYKVDVAGTGPIMVRAKNQAQAIRFACRNKCTIELLTTDEAIRLAKAGQELLDATGEPEEESSAPLLEAPQGDGQTDPAGSDATTQGAAQSDVSGQSSTSGTEEGGKKASQSKEK